MRNIYQILEPRASVDYELIATLQLDSSPKPQPQRSRRAKVRNKRIKKQEVAPPATNKLHMKE